MTENLVKCIKENGQFFELLPNGEKRPLNVPDPTPEQIERLKNMTDEDIEKSILHDPEDKEIFNSFKE